MRKGAVKRTTKETDVEVAVDLDGTGASSVATGIGFLDHMLDLLARHSRIDITVKAKGDLHIDQHHTTEDVGIALGQAVKQALGDMKGITRYADVHLPMDEALTRVAIDISGRPFLVFKVEFVRAKIGAVRYRAGAGMVSGFRHELRRHTARRHALWQQRPSYCRILLQGPGAGAAGSGRHRSARRERGAVDQGHAGRVMLISPYAAIRHRRGYATRRRETGHVELTPFTQPPLRAGDCRARSGALRVCARRFFILGVSVRPAVDAAASAVAGAGALSSS